MRRCVDIGVLDPEARVIRTRTIERGVRLPDEPTRSWAGPGAHVLETREPLLINERFAERVAELGGGFVLRVSRPCRPCIVPARDRR